MKRITFFFPLFFFLFAITSYSQSKKPDQSAPVDIKQTGLNKVLCMKSGKTLLFHFEPAKAVIVKVFDSLRKNTATQKHVCNLFDINTMKEDAFKGLFEINGEAVLFIDQERLSRHGLVRLRFNGDNGKLIEEKLLGESPGISKRTNFFVMKNKNEDSYAVLFSTDISQFEECEIHVTWYNSEQVPVREVPLDIDRKNYDYLNVVSAESQPNGVLVSLDLLKLGTNATASNVSRQVAIYDHHLALYYIAKDSFRAHKTIVDLSNEAYPYYSQYTYNPFAKAVNALLFSYRPLFYSFGLDTRRGSVSSDLFFKLDEESRSVKLNVVNNSMANAALRKRPDTSELFYGIPLNMFTNENGLTTLISEGYERYDEPETRARYNYDTYFGNIAITQLDDDGNEIWGDILPLSQCFKSYRHYCSPVNIAKNRQAHPMFPDLPEQDYERQFLSVNSYSWHNNVYIIFNDDNKNFRQSIGTATDTIYNYSATNTCYYKINGKKEITKNYLFGDPAKNEFKCSFIEGADFDEQRGVYAALVQRKRGDNVSLVMAWGHLD